MREWGKYGHESRVFLEIGSYFDKIRALEKSFFRKNLKKGASYTMFGSWVSIWDTRTVRGNLPQTPMIDFLTKI